jgi:hypothetical protein
MDIEAIRKRHKDNIGYIAKREKQGRWWWMDMHQLCHDDRAALLKRGDELEAEMYRDHILYGAWKEELKILRPLQLVVDDLVAENKALKKGPPEQP